VIGAEHPGLAVLGVVVLFCVSFFFSGTETALFVLRRDRRARDPIDARVSRLLERRSALLTTLLLGNVGANVLLTAYGAVVISQLWGGNLVWVNVAVLTPLIVLVAEVTPKKLARAWPRQWASLAWWPLWVFWIAVTPIRVAYAGVVNVIARTFGADPDKYREALGTAELLEMVGSGALEHLEREIIEAVFQLEDITLERLMTPRTDFFSLSLTLPWDELVLRTRDSGHTRIPVHGARADDIVGVLLLKDLLKHRTAPPAGPRQLRSLLLPPVFVPSSKSGESMLRDFLERQFQMAFVVDEHGTLVGLITLDDLVQELIGELEAGRPALEEDSHPGGPWVVDGATDVEDFQDLTAIELPEGEYNTLAGFVFMQIGRLPRAGDTTQWNGLRFTVRAMEGRRISLVEVEREPAKEASA
jgi:CBS domain containing-hemolysin-like protein